MGVAFVIVLILLATATSVVECAASSESAVVSAPLAAGSVSAPSVVSGGCVSSVSAAGVLAGAESATSSWRVVMIGVDLNTLDHAEIVHSLCPTPDPALECKADASIPSPRFPTAPSSFPNPASFSGAARRTRARGADARDDTTHALPRSQCTTAGLRSDLD